MEYISKSIEETKKIAEDFLENIAKKKFSKNFNIEKATVVGLYGDLGAGKTAFVKTIAQILNIKEEVTSPTFIIQKRYNIPNTTNTTKSDFFNNQNFTFKSLIHIDAYRLDLCEELMAIGWRDLLSDPLNLILIEWPDRVAECMPKDHVIINFTFVDEKTRKIEYEK